MWKINYNNITFKTFFGGFVNVFYSTFIIQIYLQIQPLTKVFDTSDGND